MVKNVENTIEDVRNVRAGLGDELIGKLMGDLKRSGHISEDMEIGDFLENCPEYLTREAGYLIEKGMERVEKRKELGYGDYCHASSNAPNLVYLGGRNKSISCYVYGAKCRK